VRWFSRREEYSLEDSVGYWTRLPTDQRLFDARYLLY
jgi:hypothetical protein